MKQVKSLGLQATDKDQLLFQIALQDARIRELEHIVHALLRDRVDQEEANAWLEITGGQNTFTPSTSVVEGRGKRIAQTLDRWPDKQKWSKQDPLI